MSSKTRLKPEIQAELIKITGLDKKSLGEKISRLKSENLGLSSNAVAFLIAKDYKRNLAGKLDEEDKSSLAAHKLLSMPATIVVSKTTSKGKASKDAKSTKLFKNYKPLDDFAEQYILEVNRADYAKCYTAVFILCRKIIENLIIDIILAKFPQREDLVYNIKTGRSLRFSNILKNLESECSAFTMKGQGAIKRLLVLIEPFKEDADAKTHRWYDLVSSPTELGKYQLDNIIAIIKELEIEVKIRAKP